MKRGLQMMAPALIGLWIGLMGLMAASSAEAVTPMVVGGAQHTCALSSAGAVTCWGANSNGQLGNNSTTDFHFPVAVAGLSSGVVAITAGNAHTCALTAAGAVQCWGANNFGQLGNNSTVDSTVPVTPIASGIIAVSAGGDHTCAITSRHGLQCWGDNTYGQLGDNSTTQRNAPVWATWLGDTGWGGGSAYQVFAGVNHTCILNYQGTGLECWGDNRRGELGEDPSVWPVILTPILLTNLQTSARGWTWGDIPTTMQAGGGYSCIVAGPTAYTAVGGVVKCWGDDSHGQLGDSRSGAAASSLTGLEVPGLGTGGVVSTAVSTGGTHACALTNGGAVWCWGTNSNGQVGGATLGAIYAPAAVPGLGSGVTGLGTGGAHTCAIVSTGGVLCLGANTHGQLGNGSTTDSSTAVAVVGAGGGTLNLLDVTPKIAGGWSHTCALSNTGVLECWGLNDVGELGIGSVGIGSTMTSLPVAVSSLSVGSVDVGAGLAHSCALNSAGGVACWGLNSFGQLGDGTTVNKAAPVAVSGLSNAVAVAAGQAYNCALSSSGGVSCWGGNAFGQLGDGTTTDKSVPVTVANSGFTAIAAGGVHTCAVTGTGGAQCWGANVSGQLGDGTTVDKTTPVAVSTLTGLVAVASGSSHSCALTKAGEVWCWGENRQGQLGYGGSSPTVNVPIAVTTLANPTLASGVVAIGASSSGSTTCALTKSGTLYCWGDNSYGQLGNPTVTASSSNTPVAVQGLAGNVLAFGVGALHVCALVTNGQFQCWGNNWSSQLGNGGNTNSNVPITVTGLTLTLLPQTITFPALVTKTLGMAPFTVSVSSSSGLPVSLSSTTPSVCSVSGSTVTLLGQGTCILAADQTGNLTFAPATQVIQTFLVQFGQSIAFDTIPDQLAGSPPFDITAKDSYGLPITFSSLTPTICTLSGTATVTLSGTVGTCTIAANQAGKPNIAAAPQVTQSFQVRSAQTISFAALADRLLSAPAFSVSATASSGLAVGFSSTTPGVCSVSGSVVAILGLGTCTIAANQTGDATHAPALQVSQSFAVSMGTIAGSVTPMVVTGDNHTCALSGGGAVLCWGDNTSGEVGNGSTTPFFRAPTPVTGLSHGVVSIAAGAMHTCALTDAGAVLCWGYNNNGQLGNGSQTISTVPVVAIAGPNSGVVAISAGLQFSCAVSKDGSAQCWGWNTGGVLGTGGGNPSMATKPVAASALPPGVVAIAAGGSDACALTNAGNVGCWGIDSGGLGDGGYTMNVKYRPVAPLGLPPNVVSVVAARMNGDRACAVSSAGSALCWGENANGALGNGTTTVGLVPGPVSTLSNVAAMGLGANHSCAVTTAGAAWCWGFNGGGVLGDGTNIQRLTPVAVKGLSAGQVAIDGGYSHTCALSKAGIVHCWGANSSGQLGDGSTTNSLTPVTVRSLKLSVAKLAAGGEHICGLSTLGGVECWGGNASGELGDGSVTDAPSPVPVIGLGSGIVDIAAGGVSGVGGHSCALNGSGGVLCWGANAAGQLGDGTTLSRDIPVAVPPLASGMAAVVTGGAHSCALSSLGVLQCWGDNSAGQLGNGSSSTVAVTAPVAVSGLPSGNTVVAASAGKSHTCALLSDSSVECWGNNASGQLGRGASAGNPNVPAVVSGLIGTAVLNPGPAVTTLAAGLDHTCVVTNVGGVKCWGDNSNGQLGNNSTGNASAPVDVILTGAPSGAVAIAAGAHHSCALLADGSVWCWGANAHGQLGNGATADSPVAVPTVTSGGAAIAAGDDFTCVMMDTGAVQCWGYDNHGQIGNGSINTTPNPNPGVVPGLNMAPKAQSISFAKLHDRALGSPPFTLNGTASSGLPVSYSSTSPDVCAVYGNTVTLIAFGTCTIAADQAGDGSYGPATQVRQSFAVGTATTLVKPMISAGYGTPGGGHTCAVSSDGSLQCWGNNAEGELGITAAYIQPNPTPHAVAGLGSGVLAVASGSYHTCAVTISGGAMCWGDNSKGQLGNGSTTSSNTWLPVSGLASGVVAITAGFSHTCALINDGTVKCWGWNLSGQLGNGSTVDSTIPVVVSGLAGAVGVTAGADHNCAILSNGGAMCWGGGAYGQLGNGSSGSGVTSSVPVAVSGLGSGSGLVAISSGPVASHTCALTSSGAVQCWGNNFYGQLGVSNAGPGYQSAVPVTVSGPTNDVAAIAVGTNQSCAVTRLGTVRCWGIVLGTTSSSFTPVAVAGLTGITAVASSNDHNCALDNTGAVFCWGYNAAGQLGNGLSAAANGSGADFSATPVAVVGPFGGGHLNLYASKPAVVPGERHTCVLGGGGTVQCWGWNKYGQLGNGTTTNSPTPTAVQLGAVTSDPVASITSGELHSCALTSAGAVYCWGDNESGQLGNGSTVASAIPVPVTGMESGVIALSSGERAFHTCALTRAGGVWCWGANWLGQIGDGTTSDALVPQPVPSLQSGVLALVAGLSHTCALTNSGSVLCWGRGDQLGNGGSSGAYSLTPVTTFTAGGGVFALGVGSVHTCAHLRGVAGLMAAGQVMCWGENWAGEVGLDPNLTNSSYVSTPWLIGIQFAGQVASSGGLDFHCSLDLDGHVSCWGGNDFGVLGQDPASLSTSTEPITQFFLPNVPKISLGAGDYHACTISYAGAVQCWGANALGQLGNGTTTDSYLPVTVVGLNMNLKTQGITFLPLSTRPATDPPTPLSASASSGLAVSFSSVTPRVCTVGGNVLTLTGVPGYCTIAANQAGNSVYAPAPQVTQSFWVMVPMVVAGSNHTCSLSSTGAVECWGSNQRGQVGNGSTATSVSSPVPVTGLTHGAVSIAAGADHTCALTEATDLLCWGQIDGSANNATTPTKVMTGVAAVAVGGRHACAVLMDGSMWCWGDNSMGQLGNGTVVTSTAPVKVKISGAVVSIAAGSIETCAVTSDGIVRCWGYLTVSSAGNFSATPTVKAGLPGAVSVSAGNGSDYLCALSTAGAAWCWGTNAYGNLGNGSTSAVSMTPVQVSGLGSGVTAIAAGAMHACALTSAGAVQCWGQNQNGQLGDGTIIQRNTPVAVTGLSSGVVAIAAGQGHSCALTAAGTVLCWGSNASGQLGNGTLNDSNTPVSTVGLNLSFTAQTINFAALANQSLGTGTFNLTATASSGLPVSFSTSTQSVCTVSGNTVTLRSVGLCVLIADQPGNATYAAAPQVIQAFQVVVTSLDFAGTGKSALIWHNSNGAAAIWLMNGTTQSSAVQFGPYAGWSVLSGDADFNGDGKSDLLWTNSNGAAAVWLMNGTTQTSAASFGPYPGWSVVSGNHDFNGDGKSDLLWKNTDGSVAIWLMNGTTVLSQASYGPYPGWSIVSGNNDFNGDGKSDLLWKNSNGAAALWLMNGTTQTSATQFGPYTGWSILSGSSDYDGDGKTDLLWSNSNGAAALWLMNGLTQTSATQFGPYTGWTVVPGRRDFNGDGKSDLLWTNTNGAAAVWLMNGLTQTSAASFGPFTGWSITSGIGDYNGDGMTDLLWSNTDGSAAVWLMNGTTQTSAASFGPYSGWSVLTGAGSGSLGTLYTLPTGPTYSTQQRSAALSSSASPESSYAFPSGPTYSTQQGSATLSRTISWAPGIPGGVPQRTTVCATLSATGNGDDAAINAALASCPDNQVVMLNPGSYNIKHAIIWSKSNVVLRGSGGPGVPAAHQTRLMADPSLYGPVVNIGLNLFPHPTGTGVNLTADAMQGTNTATVSSTSGFHVGDLVTVDMLVDPADDTGAWIVSAPAGGTGLAYPYAEYNPERSPAGDASRGWFSRFNRPTAQIMEIQSISGNTITFSTTFHMSFDVAHTAQVASWDTSPLTNSGLENVYVSGVPAPGGSNQFNDVVLTMAKYSWVKNVETDNSNGYGIGIDQSFRSIVRDSYIHSTINPTPGGAGYGLEFSMGSADNLAENDISWNFDKVMVMRASGGGNVLAYNYMDDGWIAYQPNWVESGINAAHMATPHFELFEGNLSFALGTDDTWGGATFITWLRNVATNHRSAWPPLNTYVYNTVTQQAGGCTPSGPFDGSCVPYTDAGNRAAAEADYGNDFFNYVGNVLGSIGMPVAPQFNGFAYANGAPDWTTDPVPMWMIGFGDWNGNSQTDAGVVNTIFRDGNYDYATNSVKWAGTPRTIPDSLYVGSKPAFFGSYSWPWSDGSNASHPYYTHSFREYPLSSSLGTFATSGTMISYPGYQLPAFVRFLQLHGIEPPPADCAAATLANMPMDCSLLFTGNAP